MAIDRDYLRQHYTASADDALDEVDRAELLPDARAILDEEISRRRGGSSACLQSAAGPDYTEVPEWFDTAAMACSFANYPGVYHSPEAAQACDILQAAGIPACISTEDLPEDVMDASPVRDFRVLVPGALAFKAVAVLDVQVFNPIAEATWKTHIEGLTDQQLLALSPEVVCAGFADRIERLTRAYHEEVARRSPRT